MKFDFHDLLGIFYYYEFRIINFSDCLKILFWIEI